MFSGSPESTYIGRRFNRSGLIGLNPLRTETDSGFLQCLDSAPLAGLIGSSTGDDAHGRIAAALDEQLGGEITQIAKTQVRFKVRKRAIDNITATNRELFDDRVGELTLERERLEQKLESLTHLMLSKEESEEIIAETVLFVAALKSSLTDGPLDQRQAATRRCVEQIVVNRKEGQCRITLRRIPTIAGEPLAAATDDKVIQIGAATGRSPRKH